MNDTLDSFMIKNRLVEKAENVKVAEQEYATAKLDLELLKADYILNNDWETVLGKKKPTQKDKDSYIDKGTEEKRREVDRLKVEADYAKRLYDIELLMARLR